MHCRCGSSTPASQHSTGCLVQQQAVQQSTQCSWSTPRCLSVVGMHESVPQPGTATAVPPVLCSSGHGQVWLVGAWLCGWAMLTGEAELRVHTHRA
jgi:hypothetical protein